jgi:hypothetical protein
VRERALEAAPRLDRRAHDDELGATLVRHACDLLAEQPRARPDDLAPYADAVRSRDCRGRVEPVAQPALLAVEACVERQLPLDEERRDEDDPCAAVGREPAREIERLLRLLPLEQRHDDRPIADRTGPTREPPGAMVQQADVGESHLTSG